MSVDDILATAAQEGVELAWRNGQVMFRPAPSPELRRLVDQHRMQLAAHLTGSVCAVCGQPCHPEFNPHPTCQKEDLTR